MDYNDTKFTTVSHVFKNLKKQYKTNITRAGWYEGARVIASLSILPSFSQLPNRNDVFGFIYNTKNEYNNTSLQIYRPTESVDWWEATRYSRTPVATEDCGNISEDILKFIMKDTATKFFKCKYSFVIHTSSECSV